MGHELSKTNQSNNDNNLPKRKLFPIVHGWKFIILLKI